METETYTAKITRLARETAKAAAERETYYETAVAARHAELLKRDRLDGRKRGAAARRRHAHDDITMEDCEYRRLCAVEDAARVAYDAAKP